MWRYLIPAALFVTLVWFFARGLYLDPGYVPSPFVGKPAPGFSLPKLKDPAARLERSDIVGELALVNVWATWCVGCRQEHGFLVELAGSAGLPIYGLNWKDDRGQALRWLEQLGDPYVASGFDASGDTAIDWGVYGAPETFLLAPDGTVLYKHLSPLTRDIWSREFLPRIAAVRGE
jgi:cytochrome c biogenesis protein CcmG/thiol:disulfide interchange protein DsbE